MRKIKKVIILTEDEDYYSLNSMHDYTRKTITAINEIVIPEMKQSVIEIYIDNEIYAKYCNVPYVVYYQ